MNKNSALYTALSLEGETEMPNPPDYVFDEVPRPTEQSTPEALLDNRPQVPVPPTDAEIAAAMEDTYRGHARSKFSGWHPLDDIKAQKVEEEVAAKLLEDARRKTPSENDLLQMWLAANPQGGPAWYTEKRDIIIPGAAWVGTYTLHEIGVPEGSELFTQIEKGLHPMRKPLSASDMPFVEDYAALSWPADAGPSRRFVRPWQDKLIRLILRESGLTKPGSPHILPPVNLWNLIQEEIPEPKYLIQDLLREAGAAMIYGAPGVGKSWFVQSLAILIAIGQIEMQTLSLRFPAAGIPILYIDGEMTKYDFQQRTKQLISALGLDIADPSFNRVSPA
jgi:AAA domain